MFLALKIVKTVFKATVVVAVVILPMQWLFFHYSNIKKESQDLYSVGYILQHTLQNTMS